MLLVPLPGDDELGLYFARHLLEILKDKGIYRRGNMVVRPDKRRACLEIMTAPAFSTWVEHHLVCYKMKFQRGAPYQVLRTMNNKQAENVLACEDFWNGLAEIAALNPTRSLSMDEQTGDINLLPVGYDERTKTLTFE